MDPLLFLIIGIVVGGIGGYLLATHMHSIADAAAQKVVSTIAGVVGSTATLSPSTTTFIPNPPAPPPAPNA